MRRVMAAAAVSLLGAWIVASAPAGAPTVVNDGHGELVFVPAGAFKMGDNFGDGDPRERPVHIVELDAFYIGKYEMTNGEWKTFRDDPGYDDAKFWPGGRVAAKDQIPYWTQANNHGGATPGSDNYPVLGVNWDSAVAYCNWLSAKTGKTYRLPTEAEWEKAARGGLDGCDYPWGDSIDASLANYDTRDTCRVRSFAANGYGLHEIVGNVWEWCADWYAADAYASSPRRSPRGPAGGSDKVLRGGSIDGSARTLRISYRHWTAPQRRSSDIGFRCVRDVNVAP